MRARCSARLRANPSGAWSARSMWSIAETSSVRVEALHCLVDIDFSPGDLLHQLDSTGGRGRGPLDPDLYEQRLEPGPPPRLAAADAPPNLFPLPPPPT